MPRYFFDSTVSGDFVEDVYGRELSNLPAVRHHALDALADVARDAIPRGSAYVTIFVRNEAGDIVYSAAATLTERDGPI